MRSSVAGFLPMGKKENLVRTASTGKSIASPVGGLVHLARCEFRSFGTRGRVLAAGVGGVLVVSAPVLGVAAAGLGLLAVGAFLVALRRPYLLGPMVALLLPARESIVVLNAQVAPLEAVVGGGALGYLIFVTRDRERLRLSASDWTFAALLAFIAFSTVGPVDNSDRVRELLFWSALAVNFHAVRTQSENPRSRRLLLVSLAVAAIVEVSYALFEYVDQWSDRFSVLGGAIVYPLPQGTLAHPNALGQFLVLAGLTVLALALDERGWWRRVGLIAGVAGSLALAVTFSRTSWMACTAGISVYLVERRARLPVLLAGAAVALAAIALVALDAGAIGARIASLSNATTELYDFRFEVIGRGARIAADHPLTGSGHFAETGVYAGQEALATHPHNLFIGLAVFFGIPAALAFAVLVMLAFRATVTRLRGEIGSARLREVGLLGVLVAFLVNGALEYPFWNGALTVLIVLILAVTTGSDPPVASVIHPAEGLRDLRGATRTPSSS